MGAPQNFDWLYNEVTLKKICILLSEAIIFSHVNYLFLILMDISIQSQLAQITHLETK